MIKQTLLIFAIPLLTLISCNKEESTYFLQGKIVKGCENLPVKNESFALNIERQKIFKGGSVSVPFSTDENGSFCVEYTTKGSGLLNPILTKGSEQIIELTNSGDVGK
ncbi:MAG: hypothetical protein ACPGVD_11950, partial [Flavobacteriales bacterium]